MELEPWFKPGFLLLAWQLALGLCSLGASGWESFGKRPTRTRPTPQPPHHCFTPGEDPNVQEMKTVNEQKSVRGRETDS